MSTIKIIGGLLLALGVLISHGNAYAITGLQGTGECPAILIQNRSDLIDALKNLSPETLPASKYYQADKSRFVFCIDPDAKFDKYTFIQQATTLTNATTYPVIIYGLTVDSGFAAVGQTLLTVNGPILLQNLSAPILRGPIVMNGTASMQGSVLACDTTAGNIYANAILELKGQSGGVNTVAILNCQFGINVTGTRNIVTDVKATYDKALVGSIDDGLMGVSLGASNILKASSLGKTIISGYTTAIEMKSSVSEISRSRSINVLSNGAVKMNDFSELSGSSITGTIHVNGNNVLVSKNTLGGDPAVQIAKGMSGVKVTQNTFTKVNTIAYMDPEDAKARELLSFEWMGKHVSESDPTVADRIVGRLLDQESLTANIEFGSQKEVDTSYNLYELKYVQACGVHVATQDVPITFKQPDGSLKTNIILQGEKYFDCEKGSDGKSGLMIPLKNKARFLSNTPTVSVMSADVLVADLGDITVLITPGQIVSGEAGGLVDDGNDMGGNDAKIPDEVPMIGEGEVEGAGGSAMSGGATVIGGDAGPSAASPSIGGCGGQMMPGIPAQPGVMLWWLVPTVILCYKRKRVK